MRFQGPCANDDCARLPPRTMTEAHRVGSWLKSADIHSPGKLDNSIRSQPCDAARSVRDFGAVADQYVRVLESIARHPGPEFVAPGIHQNVGAPGHGKKRMKTRQSRKESATLDGTRMHQIRLHSIDY